MSFLYGVPRQSLFLKFINFLKTGKDLCLRKRQTSAIVTKTQQSLYSRISIAKENLSNIQNLIEIGKFHFLHILIKPCLYVVFGKVITVLEEKTYFPLISDTDLNLEKADKILAFCTFSATTILPFLGQDG